MNYYVKIIPLKRFVSRPVKIYTVHVGTENDWREENEFENWTLRHRENKLINKEFQEILRWIEIASEGKHDLSKLLRDERKAHAFPPEARFLLINFDENLRLYCMLIGQKILILFNGAIKSKGVSTVQECPNVKPYFYEANKFCAAIENTIKHRELEIDFESGEILGAEKLEIIV